MGKESITNMNVKEEPKYKEIVKYSSIFQECENLLLAKIMLADLYKNNTSYNVAKDTLETIEIYRKRVWLVKEEKQFFGCTYTEPNDRKKALDRLRKKYEKLKNLYEVYHFPADMLVKKEDYILSFLRAFPLPEPNKEWSAWLLADSINSSGGFAKGEREWYKEVTERYCSTVIKKIDINPYKITKEVMKTYCTSNKYLTYLITSISISLKSVESVIEPREMVFKLMDKCADVSAQFTVRLIDGVDIDGVPLFDEKSKEEIINLEMRRGSIKNWSEIADFMNTRYSKKLKKELYFIDNKDSKKIMATLKSENYKMRILYMKDELLLSEKIIVKLLNSYIERRRKFCKDGAPVCRIEIV